MSVRQSDTARIVAVGSGKGGTGKTTVAAALAFALAQEHGRDVALIDFDPQGSLTRFTGQRAVADPLRAEPVAVHGMTLYRGGATLAGVSPSALATHLARAAAPGRTLVVDMRPMLDDPGHSVVLAQPHVFLLVVPELNPESIPEARKLAAMAEARGVPFRVVGNKEENRRPVKRALEFLSTGFGTEMSQVVIKRGAAVAEAHERQLPVTAYAPDSPPGRAIRQLADELVAEGVA
ncbi:ParA family protein [Roseisolibacter sp. H3M3-2]|uniref:ParA family protein n=1 Tax=Roseisolibacter sp. H3M3-2 TaxID=3031323 RepID=UPI0023D9FBF0|nr:ParA family protein [Roseisolibacter sp. H3M3-2]MDF1504283.1 ParA family protein [Roseisolibacter sp. H3M3-2]